MVDRRTLHQWAVADRVVSSLNAAVEASLLPRSGRVTTITSSRGSTSVVDEEELWATGVSWHEHRSGKNIYLCHSYASTTHVFLHNHILPARPRVGPLSIDVDHVDGDSLNNRRQNLRYLSHSANVAKGCVGRSRKTRAAV